MCNILVQVNTAMRTGFKNKFEWSTMKLSSSCPEEVPLSMRRRHFIFHFPFCAIELFERSCGFRRPFFFTLRGHPVCTYFLGGLTQSHARLPSLGSVFFTWISVFCVPVRHSEEEEEEAWVVTENSYYYYYCVADGHLLVIFLFQSNHFLLLLINALKCSVSGLRVRASNDDH